MGDFCAECGNYLAVDFYETLLDKFIGFTARADAGVGHEFIQTNLFVRIRDRHFVFNLTWTRSEFFAFSRELALLLTALLALRAVIVASLTGTVAVISALTGTIVVAALAGSIVVVSALTGAVVVAVTALALIVVAALTLVVVIVPLALVVVAALALVVIPAAALLISAIIAALLTLDIAISVGSLIVVTATGLITILVTISALIRRIVVITALSTGVSAAHMFAVFAALNRESGVRTFPVRLTEIAFGRHRSTVLSDTGAT